MRLKLNVGLTFPTTLSFTCDQICADLREMELLKWDVWRGQELLAVVEAARIQLWYIGDQVSLSMMGILPCWTWSCTVLKLLPCISGPFKGLCINTDRNADHYARSGIVSQHQGTIWRVGVYTNNVWWFWSIDRKAMFIAVPWLSTVKKRVKDVWQRLNWYGTIRTFVIASWDLASAN